MKDQCYYPGCQKTLHNLHRRPFCKNHHQELVNIILSKNNKSQKNQSGGNLLNSVTKIGNLFKNNATKVTGGLESVQSFADTASAAITQAEALTNQASSISQEIGQIKDQFSTFTSAVDTNYSDDSLALNSPLSSFNPSNAGTSYSQANNFQSFGDYICIKKSFVQDLRILANQLMNSRAEF